MEQRHAVATSMVAVVVTALVATANNMRSDEGLIHWKIVLVVAISAAIFSWIGSDWMKQLSNPVLTKIFAVLMIVVGLRMLWR